MTNEERDHLNAAVWAALAYVAKKELHREALDERSDTPFSVKVHGVVGDSDERWEETIRGSVLTGAPSERASSRAPDATQLIAYVLSKLNEATRRKVLLELPQDFKVAGGALPEVDSRLVKATDIMLAALRTKTRQTVQAPLSVDYELVQ